MKKHRIPNAFEEQIMKENGLEKEKSYAVVHSEAGMLHLLCHETRDEIMIIKGDRKW